MSIIGVGKEMGDNIFARSRVSTQQEEESQNINQKMAFINKMFVVFINAKPLIISSARLSRYFSVSVINQQELTLTSENNGIRRICLNNPSKRNALSLEMLNCLYEDLTRVSPDLRVIILAANGAVFSAGHDLRQLTSANQHQHSEILRRCTQVMSSIEALPVPVIAQVQGLATAAGCQLVASCDIVIAADTAQFATPGVSVGVFCSTPAVAIGRSVPRKVAMEMLFTGRPLSAQDAVLHGLVTRVVSEERLQEETMKVAERICETSASVAALGKTAFYKQIMMRDKQDAYRYTEDVMVNNLSLADAQEGIKAFVEKRKPVWSHGTDKVH